MKVLTLILILAITMALSVTVTMKKTTDEEYNLSDAIEAPTTSSPSDVESFPLQENAKMPSRRVSRFLLDQQVTVAGPVQRNVCEKDQPTCVSIDKHGHAKNSTCCNLRCVHIGTDRRNCGSCGKLCDYGNICCGGHCVDQLNDAKHCGQCHTKCHKECKNGYCDYAA